MSVSFIYNAQYGLGAMINSVANEGLRGLQTAQREIQKSAGDIANLSIPQNQNAAPQNPSDVTLPPVASAPKTPSTGNIGEPIVELKRQELLFNSSAKVLSVANQTLGSLLDVKT